jgi:hypothetical protein
MKLLLVTTTSSSASMGSLHWLCPLVQHLQRWDIVCDVITLL